MKSIRQSAFIYICLIVLQCVHSEPFITSGVAAVGSAITAGLMAGFDVFNCMWNECCTDRWISPNFTGKTRSLQVTLIIFILKIEMVNNTVWSPVPDFPQ